MTSKSRRLARLVTARSTGTIKFVGNNYVFFCAVALRPNAGHGLLILEVF